MKYIFDTHTLLWSIFDSSKLSSAAEKIMLDKTLRKCISISSLWEIAIKNRIGKLPLPGGLASIYAELEKNGFGVVGVYRSHIEAYNTLPLIHRDPFDGIIVATAIAENMVIVTADENIQKYDVSWVW
jgi:PIN domain nuclease of toxin-antitoxin system